MGVFETHCIQMKASVKLNGRENILQKLKPRASCAGFWNAHMLNTTHNSGRLAVLAVAGENGRPTLFQKEFSMKAFARGTLYILTPYVVALATSLCACSSAEPQQENISLPEQESISLQEAPPGLSVEVVENTAILTPMVAGQYSERSTTFTLRVSGFINNTDAGKLGLNIAPVAGLHFSLENPPASENTKSFGLTVSYDGTTAFPEGFANLQLHLTNIPEGYAPGAENQSLRLVVVDGQAKARSIPIGQANVEAFNAYANTVAGLALHYRLTENIWLKEPVWPETNNWTPIGTASRAPYPYTIEDASPFVGSLDGGGHTLFGLRLYNIEYTQPFQGLFGYIEGATLENIGLVNVQVFGSYTDAGSLVGQNAFGTVRNCYAAGNVSSSKVAGGLVGINQGTVQDSYFSGNAISNAGGAHSFAGGLVGINEGTVHNGYATGTASAGYGAGGLVGQNEGTVHSSHATGNVTAVVFYASVGGLVGINTGTVHDCYATGSATGDYYAAGAGGSAGGLVGANNSGTVRNCYATGYAANSMSVGGLVGSSNGAIEHSYATGMVSNEGAYAGGLVGYNNGRIEYSYATGSASSRISADSNAYFPSVGGLVGRNDNSGIVRNCMALNSSVGSIVDAVSRGRVLGSNEGFISNNHAFSGMRGNAGNTTWLNIGEGEINGANLSAAALQIANGFPSVFTTTPWTYVEGQLPGLGQTVDMPSHLASP